MDTLIDSILNDIEEKINKFIVFKFQINIKLIYCMILTKI